MSRSLFAILTVALASAPLAAFVGPPADQAAISDLLPADAFGAAGIRDFSDLCERYGRFSAAIGKPGGDKRLRGLGALASTALGVEVSEGLLLLSAYQGDDVSGAVFVKPCPDPDAAAVALGLGKGGLKPGRITPHRHGEQDRFALLRGGHLHISENEKALKTLAAARRLKAEVPASYRAAMSSSDLFVHFNTRAGGSPFHPEGAANALKPEGKAEEKAAKQAAALMGSVRHLLIGVNLGDGIGLRLTTLFQKDMPADAQALLTSLRGGPAPSSLHGLPTGKVILAHAASTDGSKNEAVARLLLRAALQNSSVEGLLSRADQPLFTGVFSTLWRKVQGRRLALYQNADELRHGLFSLVGVLDTDDPKRFLAEVGDLARFAAGKDLDLSSEEGKGADLAAVKKLLADLDSDDYEVREGATTKLMLIGEPALPLVEEAAKSSDPEVRRRASRLLEAMKAFRDARRREALAGEAAKHLRPGFVLERAAEKIEGLAVDVVHIRLEKKDAEAAALMRKLAGPGWARVRMAAVGKRVVVLAGSDTEMFRQAVRNVRDGEAGLEASATLESFRRQAGPARMFEAHVALESLEALSAGGIDGDKIRAGGLSSLAVSVESGRFEVSAWLTPAGFKALARKMGWWLFL